VHPPANPRLRAWCIAAEYRPPLAYLARDRAMVDEADILIAAPRRSAEEANSGTWYTINYAARVGRPVIIVYPSGYCEHHENLTPWPR
jgi:nucleoside 2-deoxyribosyltransferase